MPDTLSSKVVTEGAADHPAMRAWRALRPGGVDADRIELLKGRKSTARRSAYRLVGVGPGGVPVIAKRYPRAKALVERLVYEDILPHVTAVSAPRFYGCVDDADGANESSCWLFLEDVGGQRYCASNGDHRRMASRWLGQLHAVATELAPSSRLPELGPTRWLKHVRSARRRIEGNLGNAALTVGGRAVLGDVLGSLDRLEARWDGVEATCRAMPRTLVHGDFVAKNIAVRPERGGDVLLPFDWGQAGWGPPALDLAQSPPGLEGLAANADLSAYSEVVRGYWPGVDLAALREWARLGTVIRAVMAVDWEAVSLASDYVIESVERMRLYRDALGTALETGELARRN
jgi:aminoglycoside phosphotransferase (APT) family kinase protein